LIAGWFSVGESSHSRLMVLAHASDRGVHSSAREGIRGTQIPIAERPARGFAGGLRDQRRDNQWRIGIAGCKSRHRSQKNPASVDRTRHEIMTMASNEEQLARLSIIRRNKGLAARHQAGEGHGRWRRVP